MKNLLLTVPHGFCPPSPVRECDLRALSTSKIISNLYRNIKGQKADLVYIPKKRVVVDLNRVRPFNEEGGKIWDEFNKRIKKKLKKDTLLLDVHSFPIGDFEGAQIAILELSHQDRDELRDFVDFAKRETGLDIKIFKGMGNYIQDYYSKYTYPLLVEFCEDRDYLSNHDINLFVTLLIKYF
jgi:hypothetical protein